MANHTILIIDYEPRNVEAASRPLENAGYQVATASDGVAGIKAFESLNPSLVLIEAMLPKKHGFEVCQEIKKTTHGKRTPVVITTAVYRGRKYRTQALHIYGADEYLEKPFTADQLLEVCSRFLGEPPGVVPEADESEQRIAVNARTAQPPVASAPAVEPDTPTPATGVFSRIVGDLTEEEITARLDAVLPGELTDLEDEGIIASDPARAVPEPTDEALVDRGIVDDLPPEIADTFVTTEQPVTAEPVELPPVIEPEPAQPQHEASGAAADVESERNPEEASEAVAEKKDVVVGESDEPSQIVEFNADHGRKRRRKKKKRGARSKSSKSGPTPAPETAPELTEGEAVVPAEAAALQSEARPQSEQTVSEETVSEPRSEMDELADVVSAAIDQMQILDAPEAEEVTVDEPAAEEAAPEELATAESLTEGPETEEPPAEVAVEHEPAPETETLERVSTEAAAETTAEDTSAEPARRRKTGLWIGVAAAVVVGLAITLFFVFRGGDEGRTTAGAMPAVTPAPAKVRTTTPSSPAQGENSANAAMVLAPGAGNDAPESATTVTAAAPTAKPEPPVSRPATPPAKVESAPVAVETDVTTEEPTATSDDDAAKIEEIETLAPAVMAPPTVETPTPAEESLPEPATPFQDESEAEPAPAIENERVDDEPTPVTSPPTPKAVTGDLVPLREVDQQPSPLDQPPPDYPMSARRLRREGTVSLNVLVDENGDVTAVELVRGVSRELDGAAIRAVMGWTYKPAKKDGVNVKVWKPVKVGFELDR